MNKILIAGIGNVLLGDDGIGPYAIEVLKSEYDFPENVELADLGTPGLDLPIHLAGADAVILVDCAKLTVQRATFDCFANKRSCGYLRALASIRIHPHSGNRFPCWS